MTTMEDAHPLFSEAGRLTCPESRERRGGRLRPVALLSLASSFLLTGCLETQVPLITPQNALTSPVIQDGIYCEIKFTFIPRKEYIPIDVLVAERNNQTCLSLEWDDQARGWHTSLHSLGVDEHGVSIRARRFGDGKDPLGLSSFVMVQAGAPPRQVAVAGRLVAVDGAHLLSVFAESDMFAVIDLSQPASRMQESAREQGVRLSESGTTISVTSAGVLSSNPADAVGKWLAQATARAIYAADLPGIGPDTPTIRVFARSQSTHDNQKQFQQRVRDLIDNMLFEASVLSHFMKLELTQAKIDTTLLDLQRVLEPVKKAFGAQTEIYTQASRCLGLTTASLVETRKFSTILAQITNTATGQNHAIIRDEISKVRDMTDLIIEGLLDSQKIVLEVIQQTKPAQHNLEPAEAAYNAGLAQARPAAWPGFTRMPGELANAVDPLVKNYRLANHCLEDIKKLF